MRRSSKLAERTRLETWVFIVKSQTNVTPRFLTESNKGTDAQSTVIKSGKEKVIDLDFRPEDTIIAPVLSSFTLSLFNAIQDLMSSIHFCTERKRSGIWWGGAGFWSWESSTYEWWRIKCFSITVEEELYRERTGQVQWLIPVGHWKRWELAQLRSNGCCQTECSL